MKDSDKIKDLAGNLAGSDKWVFRSDGCGCCDSPWIVCEQYDCKDGDELHAIIRVERDGDRVRVVAEWQERLPEAGYVDQEIVLVEANMAKQ